MKYSHRNGEPKNPGRSFPGFYWLAWMIGGMDDRRKVYSVQEWNGYLWVGFQTAKLPLHIIEVYGPISEPNSSKETE